MRDILEAEVIAKKAETKQAAKFFADAGAYAPTIGIIGTVMGLVHVLENLAEPEKLGHLIAGAFVATLWGVMSANVIFLPIGTRLKRLSELEAARMELVIEGVAAAPGRLEPPHRRPAPPARCSPPTSASRRPPDEPAGPAARSTRSTRSTRTTSAGWSRTPTW